jgi:hypothetical protein
MNLVHIELQRVQTWLFAVPRLRAMLGANVLLGETLRFALPELARQTERGWKLAGSDELYPNALADDPLRDHDDPASDAKDGILSRDGGHFEALFEGGAEAFADAAGKLLRSNLPGLRFRISIRDERLVTSRVHLSAELPVFAPCEWTGRGLQSDSVQQGEESWMVSLDVKRRHEAAQRAEDGTAKDIVTLLNATTKIHKQLKRPQEIKEMVGDGYLALIHADGNGVGIGVAEYCQISQRASFFHRNRVLLRRAVRETIDSLCPDTGIAPLIPLMLGGDDILLLSRADIALPFIVTLCKKLDELQTDNSSFKLTLGIGAVFAKRTVPIHRIHEVAEQLASSAKRRFRGFTPDQKRSVVDWAVYSTSWVDDPAEVRRRHWVCGVGEDLRVLSQRPVDVLGEESNSLQSLLKDSDEVKRAPRSQIRYLVDQLSKGRCLSELAFRELSAEAKGALKKAGAEELWQRSQNGGPWLTKILDLTEIAEIANLGRKLVTNDINEEIVNA